jgi:hypothetical protein
MANSDRDIRIVPDRGASTAPAMYFTGADSLSSATIVLRVFNSSTDATLSFEGDVGQLFSITDSTFGPVFSVNDISGIPSIEVLDSGLIKLAEWNGKVQVGGANNNENATSTTTGELQVIGGVGVSRDVYVGGGMTVVGTLNAAVVTGSISNSANVGVTNDTASSTAQYLTFVSGTSGNLPIKVDSSALTFVPSTNNLGIGTTNPYSRLSLVSSAATDGISLFTSTYEAGRQWGTRIWKNDTGAGIPLQIDTQQTTTWYTTIRMGHGQDTNNPALITYYNTQLAMTSGNVGVGITPTNKLHVSGDSKVAGTFVGLRQYQTGDDFRIDFVKAANDTASARFEWNGYSAATTHLIDYFSIGLNDAASAMQTRFQIMQDGRIGLNTTDFSYTSSDNTAVVAGGIAANKIFVNGSVQLIGANDAIVFGRGTSSFMKDEELGFGWGGGWHMTDATFLRSRNNKHVYNEAPYSGSSFRNFASSYDAPNLFMTHPTDTNWTFGASSNNSDTYWMQVKYSGAGNDSRGFRVLDVASGIVRMSVADKITTHQNTFYRTFQSYTGTGNTPMKTWDGVLVAGSDTAGASTYTVIETNVPQDSYMMGGFSIEWFENYASTNGKTTITLGGYWNAEVNGGFVGWEYTSSNPNIAPTIQVGRNTSNGKTVIILTHFSANYAIIVARDLWLGYSTGAYDYGSGWTISQQSSLAAYSNLDTVVARTALPASSGAGSGLNADLLDGIDSTGFVRNSAATSGYINIDGGTQNSPTDATVFITATNNNDWGLIVNKFNGSATEYGQEIRVGSAAAYAFRVMGSGAEKMRINGEGQIFSPIYYDYNNTSYYLDPTSTTALRTVGSWRADSSTWDGEFSGKMQYHSNHWYIQAADLFIYRNAGGSNVFTINQSGSAIATGDMRAPIFYDNNNTAYYVDPASTSRIRRTNLIASGSGWDDGLNLYSADETNRWNLLVDNGAADSLRFAFNNSEALSINTSRNVTANVDIRAPIFYDSNNTAFYADPASTSRFNAIIANSINISGTGSSNSNEYLFYCDASATQARRFEIARIAIDFNDWNSVGGFEVELHEKYFGSGLIKKYTVFYGYVSNFGVHLTHYSGSGANQFRVTTSGEVTVSGDHRYISIFVDVDYYSGVTAIVRTTRNISTSNPPPIGSTFIFSTPTITNIAGFSADSIVFVPTTVQAGGDFRAPIFYDSNDTTYYVNPATDSVLNYLTLRNNTALFFSNATTAELNHNSNSTPVAFAMIKSGTSFTDGDNYGVLNLRRTNHNNAATTAGASLFFELKDSGGTVREYAGISGRKTEAGAAGGQLDFHSYNRAVVANLNSSLFQHSSSVRAPIFYDSNNTSYYTDPASTSVLYRVDINNNVYFTNFGRGMIGTYSASRYQAVFAMGDAYKLPDDGTSPSNLYGIAWSHPNAGGVAGNLNTHGALIMENGTFLAAISGSIRSRDDMRAPIFYDSNNTAYYTDPASTSRLNALTVDALNMTNGRVNTGQTVPQGHYTTGEEVFSLDPTWTNAQLQSYFNAGNVSWVADSTAPGGYAVSIVGAANVGGVYGSGFPYIPVDSTDVFYMEVWIRSVSGTNTHYMGSMDFNESFGSLGGNPGSFGYWVMSNTNPGSSWVRYSGYITGFSASTTGTFELGTKYWTPQALFNYTGGGTTYISGWKVIKTNRNGPLIVNLPSSAPVMGVTSSLQKTLTVKMDNQSQLSFGAYPGGWSPAIQLQNNDNTRMLWFGSLDSANRPRIRSGAAGLDIYTNGTTTDTGTYSATFESGSVRSPIFYDLDNTAFYLDPNATGTSTALNLAGRISVGVFNASTTNSGEAWIGRASDRAAGILTVQLGSGAGRRFEVVDSGWTTVEFSADDAGIAIAAASFRAPIFYDNNDTGYYVDPNGSSNLNSVRMVGNPVINNSSPTIYLQDTDHNVSMIHCNSNIFYVLRGSTNSLSWATTNGYWPLEINLTNNDALFGRNLTAVGEVTAYSDIRLKKDVETISDALTKVMSLRGVTYYRKDMDDDKRHIGVIAQEIQEVLPEVVSESKDNNDETVSTLSVSYGNITAVLIEAIKEQQKIIEEQGKRISALENLINKSNNT